MSTPAFYSTLLGVIQRSTTVAVNSAAPAPFVASSPLLGALSSILANMLQQDRLIRPEPFSFLDGKYLEGLSVAVEDGLCFTVEQILNVADTANSGSYLLSLPDGEYLFEFL